MQRRDSLGSTTKISRLSKGSTQKFKTRRSQSSFSSASDVFAETESTKGQPDLPVSKMKLRSEKNLDGNQGRSAEAGPAVDTLVDPFDEGERTLIRPDFEPSEDLEREEVERTEETSERSEVEPREEVLFKGMSKSKCPYRSGTISSKLKLSGARLARSDCTLHRLQISELRVLIRVFWCKGGYSIIH